MSQNIRAEWWWPELVAQGSTWKVDGSGCATVSDSETRKALDRGSVEADAFLEGALEFGWGDGDRLEETEHVCEPQPDEADVAFFQGTKNEFLLSVHTSNSMHCLLKPCYRCPARSVAGRPARECAVSSGRAPQTRRRQGPVEKIVHHRRVHTLVAIEHRSVLGAVEGDQRCAQLAGQVYPGLIRSGRVVGGGHHDDLASPGRRRGVRRRRCRHRPQRAQIAGADPVNCP